MHHFIVLFHSRRLATVLHTEVISNGCGGKLGNGRGLAVVCCQLRGGRMILADDYGFFREELKQR